MGKLFLGGLKDRSVVGAEGRLVGTLVDVEIEDDMRVSGVVLRLEGSAVEDLGLKKPLWRSAHVLLPASFVSSVTDVILLNATIAQIEERLAKATPELELAERAAGG
jgi:sporulation protein YlmC with PRC-barrel domain